jgi:phosphatidylglycerophosphate synthase
MDATPTPAPYIELKSRRPRWAHTLAGWIYTSGFSPNTISIISVLFAGLALIAYLLAPEMRTPRQTATTWIIAALNIQLRLLCNMLSEIMAVKRDKGTGTGPLYNEVTNRIADVLILVGAGYSTNIEPGVIKLWGELPLGWACAVLAMGTGYIRLLQGTLTGRQSFMGPMAKQHRMALLTLGTLAAAAKQMFENAIAMPKNDFLKLSLMIIFIGSAITCLQRLAVTWSDLRQQKNPEG